jgi:hypothetical protein
MKFLKVKVDMSIESNYIGNLSSIVKTISMLIAGAIIGLLANYGLKLGVDTATLSEVIGAIIFLVLAYIDMKYPNTMIRGKTTEPPITETPEDGEEDGC